jgi:C4-dicarboxylate-specific signal transduction histidine kinase
MNARSHARRSAPQRSGKARDMSRPLDDEVRALLDAIPGPLMLTGGGDEVLYCNDAMRAQLATRQEENLQAQRLASLGFMVAGVCHEVSNPLAAIHSMVQILQSRRGVSPATLVKGLDSIASNISRVLAITRKLGDFSRVAGDAPGPIRIDAAVQEAISLLRHSRNCESVHVRYRERGTGFAAARPGELQQVIFNVLLNAAQAMEGKGTIDVDAEAGRDGMIRLRVRDGGPGIPPGHLTRVFEPFFTTKAPGEGTGLGLAICYEIVQELKGGMRAANHPAGGAIIEIELPHHGPPG